MNEYKSQARFGNRIKSIEKGGGGPVVVSIVCPSPHGDDGATEGNNDDAVHPSVGVAPSAVRATFLPNEVKFCDLSDEDDGYYDDKFGRNNGSGRSHDDAISISTPIARNRRSKAGSRSASLANNTSSGPPDYHDADDDDDAEGEDEANKPQQRRRNHTTTADDIDADSIMSSDLSKARPKPEIPDGGYGWVVVFSSLVVSLIADGISFSFGLLYTEFLVYFGESKSKTAWIGSIFLAVPLLSGPVMSNLVDKYGCQRMTVIGGILSGVGFMLAALANSVEQLYWTFGVIGGLGLGIGYVTAVCSVVGWFDKRRTFATGIGASGTGIGTFLYAPFTQYLIVEYGWRGTCLILAGTLFNICVCGCLMLDPEWLTESNKLESRSQSMKTFSNSSVCLDEIKKLLEDGASKDVVLETLVTSYNTEANQQLEDDDQLVPVKRYRSLLLLPTYLSPDSAVPENEIITGNQLGSRRSLRKKIPTEESFDDGRRMSPPVHHLWLHNNNNNVNRVVVTPKGRVNSDESVNMSEKCTVYDEDEHISSRFMCDEELLHNDVTPTTADGFRRAQHDDDDVAEESDADDALPTNGLLSQDASTTTKPQQRRDSADDIVIRIPTANQLAIYEKAHPPKKPPATGGNNVAKSVLRQNSNYLRNMRIHRNSIHYRGAMLSTHRYRLRTSSCPNIYRNSMTTLAQDAEETWWDSVKEVLKSVFDFSLFLNPKFVYFEISTLLLFIWFIVPYFYLPEHMLTKGYVEDDSAFVISVIGVSQTVGMISLGYIGDKPWLNVPKTYACCLVVCGISVILMPIVASSYVGLSIVGGLFGLMFASSFSFTPIILVQLVSLDDFTCAYGLVLLIQGVGNLVGPPISGMMYELFGEWDYAFYASGMFISIAGGFVYITALLQDRDERKLAKMNKQDNSDIC